MRRRVSACYILTEVSSGKVAGYCTLAAASVPLTDLPDAVTRKVPRCPDVPEARVGRFDVDSALHGRKLAGALLADAAERAARSEAGVFVLIADAKNNSLRMHSPPEASLTCDQSGNLQKAKDRCSD